MQKALSIPLATRPIGLIWPLLAIDLGVVVSLCLTGFPAAAVRALHVFLRF